jgi:FG-GAP-like repeat
MDSRQANQPHDSLSANTIAKIERFCADCHTLPLPSTFPKANWPDEVRQGFDFYIESNRTDLDEPVRQDVVKYYQDAAPERILVPRADQMPKQVAPVQFQRCNGISIGESAPATAQVLWDVPSKSIIYSDMRLGTLRAWKPTSINSVTGSTGIDRLIYAGKHICKINICDWDQDGTQDYLLGEMGSFPVGDHLLGRVSLLFNDPSGQVESFVLADGLARVVEAKPFDYDGDGDLDVLVAEFGWRKTGEFKLLRNVGGSVREPKMEIETIDPKHGALGVEIADMDGDSLLDIVVAYGQEFESIEIYLNRGNGKYEHQIIFRLPDPSYNASSFQISDLDKDGRLDIVHTCGDTMDALIAKPYHGVRWIRNLGNGEWQNRELGLLVGALQATVADFDGDGDLDIAAVGLFPTAHLDGSGAYDSVCWWEQKESLEFLQHSIERDYCSHAACIAADVDLDGRIDLVVGDWLSDEKASFRVFVNKPPE